MTLSAQFAEMRIQMSDPCKIWVCHDALPRDFVQANPGLLLGQDGKELTSWEAFLEKVRTLGAQWASMPKQTGHSGRTQQEWVQVARRGHSASAARGFAGASTSGAQHATGQKRTAGAGCCVQAP